jgi:hypothetical protein
LRQRKDGRWRKDGNGAVGQLSTTFIKDGDQQRLLMTAVNKGNQQQQEDREGVLV